MGSIEIDDETLEPQTYSSPAPITAPLFAILISELSLNFTFEVRRPQIWPSRDRLHATEEGATYNRNITPNTFER